MNISVLIMIYFYNLWLICFGNDLERTLLILITHPEITDGLFVNAITKKITLSWISFKRRSLMLQFPMLYNSLGKVGTSEEVFA